MYVEKTLRRLGITLEHGAFEARETVHVCAAGCRQEDGQRVRHRQPALAGILLPHSRVGYDVMAFVGLRRFLEHRQRDEIREELHRQQGISLSTGEISVLGRRFLLYLEALHAARAPALRAALGSDGGWPLHIDATGENGRGTLLVAYAGWRRWVLGSWKIPTERADCIRPRLDRLVERFGPPCAVMRDLGRAVTEAVQDLVKSLEHPLPILSCHLHFLKDIGKDLLAESHDELRALFRRSELTTNLRAFARALGRRLGPHLDSARQGLSSWLAESVDGADGYRLPDGRRGLAIVRSFAQWVLDYPQDGADEGFPFDLPSLDLYRRSRRACRAAEAFLRAPPEDGQVRQTLVRFHRIVNGVRGEIAFRRPVQTLEARAHLFAELRDALRLQVKPPPGAEPPARDDHGGLATLRDIEAALDALTRSLRERRPQRGPAQNMRQAIDLVLDHLDRHRATLFGHVIALPESAGGGIRLVERSNVILEAFFHALKHGERRRSGRKTLTQDLEQLPPSAPLAFNLTRPDYVTILCGTLDELPRAFAQMDAEHRVRLLPSPARVPELEPQEQDVVSCSMPAADRQIIRHDALEARVLAAARSRAPRWCPSGREPDRAPSRVSATVV